MESTRDGEEQKGFMGTFLSVNQPTGCESVGFLHLRQGDGSGGGVRALGCIMRLSSAEFPTAHVWEHE